MPDKNQNKKLNLLEKKAEDTKNGNGTPFHREQQDNAAKRADKKKEAFHYIFVFGMCFAAVLYGTVASVWIFHELTPKGMHWLKDTQVMSIKDLVLFIAIALLVGEIRSYYRKIADK